VGQIVQDDLGFLWFGTQDGLQRYDGLVFRKYRHDPKNPNSLAGSNSFGLFKDRSGKLWVGSDEFLDMYDPEAETFTHFRSDRLDPGRFEGVLFDISQDRAGMIWLATDHGLNRLDPAKRRIVRYQNQPGDPTSLSSNLVRSTFEENNGTFWVATSEGLDLFDRPTGKVTQHIPLPDNFPRPGRSNPYLLISFCEDHSGVLWVTFSYGYGLAVVDRWANRLTFYSLNSASTDNTLQSGVRAIHEDEDGTLWLGTTAGGLLKLDRDRRGFVRYRNNPSDPDSLSADQVNALYEDHEGNIWVGTTGGGVNRFPRKPLPFRSYRHEPGNPNSLDTDYTSSIYEDSRGILWVGSIQALTQIDRKTGKFTFYRTAGGPGNLSSTWVISIVEDHSGHLWFGTVGGGLNRFDRRTGRFKAYRHNPEDPHSLSHDTVLDLFIDHKGTLWAGTEDGLDAFDPEKERFRRYQASGEDQNRYRTIAQDSDGALWLGTLSSGLRHLDPATGQFTSYPHTPEAGSVSNERVNSICIDHSGNIWVATASGLNRFDPATGSFATYDERDGLPNSNVNSILEDNDGDLWLSTNDGLSRFNPRAKTFRNYSVSDGLLGNEFYNYATAYKSSTGEMFFNSYAGVITFFPDQVVDNPYIPPVVLTDFLLFGKPLPIGGNSPLEQSISMTKSLTLTHAQSIFSFGFAALSYVSPERNRYLYRLEGLETKWNEADSSRRFVTYTTLSPGQYIFRVQGSNNRGIWNENGASVRIRILPAWWSTWWFRAMTAAFIPFALWFAYTFRLRGVERRNRELALQVAERTAAEEEIKSLSERLINAQEQERMRIARELHDDLNQQIAAISLSLGSIRRKLPDTGSEAYKQLERLRDKLSRLSTSVRVLSHELHPATLDYGDVAAALRGHCKEFSSLSGVNVAFEASGTFEGVPAEVALCIYRVTQEALQNVAKHAGVTLASVRLVRSGDPVCLTVSDRGVGFHPDQSRASGGLGLVSIKERVRLVRGVVELESEPHRGTILKVEIPINGPARGMTRRWAR
jgi:signal transduction histidine kinase/ligand-binding sensor domain-containing protein